ncbi:terminase [Corynebacterium cystitidis]|uniref:terminase n=1 Tax=Corynebacterium cystitidis TaxID=35757 RepID=UPI00211E2C24|nr:terminase [Corynebacterium cystitidis]
MTQVVVVAPQDRLITLPEGLPELTLGFEALAWAAKYLKHSNGQRAGKYWEFTREQARFVLWFYSIDENGRWNYQLAARRLAKGSGKSPLGATLSLIDLLAPVRLKDFDPRVPGGCIGKPVAMPWVQIAAASLDQTENTMRHVRAMTNKNVAKRLHEDYELDVGKTQINTFDGKLEIITASAISAEGAESTFVLADELEHWTPANGGLELYNTLLDNLSKSGSRMVATLNAWKPGLDTAGEEMFEEWVAQENGQSRTSQRYLMDIVQAPPETDLSDPESLRAGLEFVYADCPWVDVDAVMNRIWTARNAADSKRKYLNWPVASSDSWADPQVFAQMSQPDIEVAEGEDIVMFFDGSLSNDHTALVACRMSDGHVFTLGVWRPEARGDQKPVVNVDAVDGTVDRAFERFNVLAFFADVREWEAFTKVEWPSRYRDQLKVWATLRGQQPEPIAWDMRAKDYPFTMAAELCEAEIAKQMFTHDGHPMLVEHVRNARRHEGRFGITVRKESPTSARKIDACVCMIGARMVWRQVRESGVMEKKSSGRAFFL